MSSWDCEICHADTREEYYMVHDDIWERYGMDPFLCIGCLEERMGRKLTFYDFTHCLLNELDMGWRKSARLLDRLDRIPSEDTAEVQ